MAFPSTIDAPSTSMQGTTLVTADDHAADHRLLGSAIISIETKLGIGSGSASLNTLLIGSGAGTAQWGTVVNNITFGTPSIIGGTLGTAQITGGTAASMALGTPSIIGGTIAGSGTTTPISVGVSLAPTVGTVADSPGGTLTVNAQAQQIAYIAFGTTAGNRTIGTPTNPTNGQPLTYMIKQNTNNTGTIVWSSVFLQNLAGTVAAGTQSTYNYYSYRYFTADAKWHSQGNSTGII